MTLDRVHEDIRSREYSVVAVADLGFAGICTDIINRFYTPAILIPTGDVGGPVQDRHRAKDACSYRWVAGECLLDIRDPGTVGIGVNAARRRVPHFPFCATYPDLIRSLLAMVPPERRRPCGSFGVHAFRSFTNVVDGPHQDGFEYGVTLVLDRTADGGVSYLKTVTYEPILDYQLQPGELLFYRDSQFMHGATPLGGGHRDALVIQFDAPEDQ